MPALTIFTIPKAFEGHIDLIQRNAIQSWVALGAETEVILCGNDPGVAEAAGDYGARHLPDIACTAYGTPLLSSAFEQVEQTARSSLICYVNADIVFLPDLLTGLGMVTRPKFLMIGQRWDLDVTGPIDFGRADWARQLKQQVSARGVPLPPVGCDYFVFHKGSVGALPAFAVGRPCWDNWFIYHARALGLPVIDATQVVTAVHQNHDYRHVPARTGRKWEGPEADENRALMGAEHGFEVTDATHVLSSTGVHRAMDESYLEWRMKRQDVLDRSHSILARLRRKLLSWVYSYRRYIPRSLWTKIVYTCSR